MRELPLTCNSAAMRRLVSVFAVLVAQLLCRIGERTIVAKRSIDDTGWKRLEANMIAGPAWMLDGRSFVAATGAASAGA
jgi:hypothetical protein